MSMVTTKKFTDPAYLPKNPGALGRGLYQGIIDELVGLFNAELDVKAPITYVDTQATTMSPPGKIAHFVRNTAPTGWLKANGALISRTTYAALFAAMGTTFGVGDGSTTFQLPDLRGQFIRTWDDGAGVDTGRAFGSTQLDDIKTHYHPIVSCYIGSGYTVTNGTLQSTSGTVAGGNPPNAYTNNTGGTETRVKNVALLACIKY
jgi:microcystin-dependent protein